MANAMSMRALIAKLHAVADDVASGVPDPVVGKPETASVEPLVPLAVSVPVSAAPVLTTTASSPVEPVLPGPLPASSLAGVSASDGSAGTVPGCSGTVGSPGPVG